MVRLNPLHVSTILIKHIHQININQIRKYVFTFSTYPIPFIHFSLTLTLIFIHSVYVCLSERFHINKFIVFHTQIFVFINFHMIWDKINFINTQVCLCFLYNKGRGLNKNLRITSWWEKLKVFVTYYNNTLIVLVNYFQQHNFVFGNSL